MVRIFFVVLVSAVVSLAGIQPSDAGKKGFLGGVVVGGASILLFNSANRRHRAESDYEDSYDRPVYRERRSRREYRDRPRYRKRYTRPARKHRAKRRVVRRNPAAVREPKMTKATKRDIQDALNQRDFNVGSVDGSFGGKTRRGIRKFQSSISASATGYLTQKQVDLLLEDDFKPQKTAADVNPDTAQENKVRTSNSEGGSTEPELVVSSRGFSSPKTKGFLEDAPQ